jgi:hypothetical protein
MGRIGKGCVVTAAALLGLAGCGRQEYIQPPRPPEQCVAPPGDDPRFTNPPMYPNKLLNQDSMIKPQDDEEDGPGGKGQRVGGGMHGR